MSDITQPISELQFWPLGTASRPFPMVLPDGTLGAFNSDAASLHVPSRRPYAQSVAQLYRQMPVPSMLPIFSRMLREYASATFDLQADKSTTGETRLMHALVGAPGVGKTQMGETVAYAVDPRGPVKFNAAGVDISQVIWQTVLDPQTSTPVIEAIDERMSSGKVDGHTLSILRKMFEVEGDGILTEGAIDWEKLNARLDASRIPEFLNLTSTLLGLKNGGSSTGFTIIDVEGPAIQACKEGRILLVDELDKAKPGSAGKLQGWLEWLDGERSRYVSLSNDGQQYIFDRKMVAPGFFAVVTGNAQDDGPSSGLLNLSTLTRLAIDRVPGMQARDVVHRIEQELCGWPISTIYYGTGGVAAWGNDPQKFARFIKGLGKASDSHTGNLNEWRYVQEAAQRMGGFFNEIIEITKPNSKARREVTDANLKAALKSADDAYQRSGLAPNLRDVFRLIKAAKNPLKSGSQPSPVQLSSEIEDDWSEPPTSVQTIQVQSVDNGLVGTRLENSLFEYLRARGEDDLCAALLDVGCRHKVFSGDEDDDEAAFNSSFSSVAALLNDTKPSAEQAAQYFRNAVWATIKQEQPNLPASAKALIKGSACADVPQLMEHSIRVSAEDPKEAYIILPEENPRKAVETPFKTVSVTDPLHLAMQVQAVPDDAAQSNLGEAVSQLDDPRKLPSVTAVIVAFSLPGLRKANHVALRAASKYRNEQLTPDDSTMERLNPVFAGLTEPQNKALREVRDILMTWQDGTGGSAYAMAARGKDNTPALVWLFQKNKDYMLATSHDAPNPELKLVMASPRAPVVNLTEAGRLVEVQAWLELHQFPIKEWEEALAVRFGRTIKLKAETNIAMNVPIRMDRAFADFAAPLIPVLRAG